MEEHLNSCFLEWKCRNFKSLIINFKMMWKSKIDQLMLVLILLVGVYSICGDSMLEPSEDCDDGNTANCDGCSATCLTETAACKCGDGILQTENGEECDDGDNDDSDGCSSSCKKPFAFSPSIKFS